jgi:hypothetical protein
MYTNIPERILRILKRQPVNKTVWQPSLTYWYSVNKVATLNPATCPDEIKSYVPDDLMGLDPIALYDAIKGSIRYPHECLNLPSFYEQVKPGSCIERLYRTNEAGEHEVVVKTPAGTVSSKQKLGFPIEHFVKKPDDLDVIEYILDQTEYCFNPFVFDAASEAIEKLGIVQTYNFRSPYQRCVIEYLGLATTTKFMRKYPDRMDRFMERLESWDKTAYDVILGSPLQIVSFGENIHAKVATPPIFERYHLPYYKEHAKWIHEKGKLCHAHFDGDLKDLLPFFPELPFDGIEAVTFEPQGDVSMAEVRDAMGDKALLDGIPSIYFLPQYSDEQLLQCARDVLDIFYHRVILGISDELCPTMEGRKLRLVGDLVESYEP